MDGYKVDQQVFDMKHAENLANFHSKKEMITEYRMFQFYIWVFAIAIAIAIAIELMSNSLRDNGSIYKISRFCFEAVKLASMFVNKQKLVTQLHDEKFG